MENQPISPIPPVFTQAPIEPKPVKKSYKWLILIVVFTFLFSASSVLAYKYYQLKQQVTKIQTLPTPTPLVSPEPSAAAETAGWKTYTNTKYGFSFKYPSEYQIGSCESCFDLSIADFITLLPPSMPSAKGYGSFMISRLKDRETNQSVNDYLNELSTIVNQPIVPDSKQQTTINGYSGLVIINRDQFNDVDSKNVYVTNGLEGIRLSFNGYYSNENRGIHLDSFKNLSVFDQILSTFKFLGQEMGYCSPSYPVEKDTPELTASQNYATECLSQKNKDDCLSIDFYNKIAGDFTSPDGIPDCLWSNQ